MGKIYTSFEDFQAAKEKEFREAVEEVSYYQGEVERTTLDGEWTESDLKDDVYDETLKILNGIDEQPGWLEKHKGRAVKDEDLTKPEFIVTHICDNHDLIEVYNKCYDLNRNQKPMKFGIHYFDMAVRAEVNKILKENLLT